MESGQKVGLFFSDISGAFDRVSSDLLLQKARAAGVSDEWLSFLKDYLRPRLAHVVVDGCSSDAWTLSNTVFQGTVLGPILWNLFFADIEKVALELGMEEAKFADDFICSLANLRGQPRYRSVYLQGQADNNLRVEDFPFFVTDIVEEENPAVHQIGPSDGSRLTSILRNWLLN